MRTARWLTLLIVVVPFALFAHGVELHSSSPRSWEPCVAQAGSDRARCIVDLCGGERACIVSIIGTLTRTKGVGETMNVIQDMAEWTSSLIGNGHDLAHVVGRMLAGSNRLPMDAFRTCPPNFFYGCHHGFFEAFLGKTSSPIEAAQMICEREGKTQLPLALFSCYHGVGHGILMASGNDIAVALDVCRRLSPDVAVQGCAQGVFMENINAFGRGEAHSGIFEAWNRLAPCNRVGAWAQWACYVNHGPYILTSDYLQWRKAGRRCMGAHPAMRPICLSSFGQLAAEPEWQGRILRANTKIGAVGPFVGNVVMLLAALPEEYRMAELSGALEQLLKYNRADDAVDLCIQMPLDARSICARELGSIERLYHGEITVCAKFKEKEFSMVCTDARASEFPWDVAMRDGNFTMSSDTPFLSPMRRFIASALSMLRRTAPAPKEQVVVYCAKDGFESARVIGKLPLSVVWVNDRDDPCWPASDDHPTHEQYNGFDPRRPLQRGQRWGMIFDRRGTWTFHDHLFPTFTGILTVR